jgi:hypothetical protein
VINCGVLTKSSLFGKNKIKYLLGLMVGFVVLDGWLTQILIENGIAREGNWFLQPIVGEIGFILLKAVGALLCALILWDIYRHWPKLAMVATWCAVSFYGAVVLWNTSLFLIA